MKKDPWFRNRLIRDAMYLAIERRMDEDESVYILGEGAAVKTHFDAPEIERKHPKRSLTMPISEDSNTNFAVGMAIAGLTPVVNVISSDFLYRTMDAICNTAAKLGAVGEARTIVVQAEFMTGGPTSGQRVEAQFVGVPGLSVCCPSNPRDAFTCMRAALDHRGVTLMLEDRMIEDATTRPFDRAAEGETRMGHARLRGYGGGKVTVLSYGLTQRLLDVWLKGTPTNVVDLRWLYPVDWESVDAVAKHGESILVVEPGPVYAGVGAEIAAYVAEKFPGTRVARLGAPRVAIPSARELHERMLPPRELVMAKIEELSR